MKKLLAAGILIAGCINHSFAQADSTVTVRKEKIFEHTVGVQMNQLIKQVFNFNNATVTNVNPYLFTYSINLAKSGWGIRVGAGYTYNSGATDDGITKTISDINDMHFRLGVEKAFRLSDKWSAGVGIDGILNSNDDKTTTTVRSFDTTTTATKTVLSDHGAGVMGWLRYNLTKKVLIGTESSFYYTTGTNEQTIDITTRVPNGGGGGGTTPKTTETKLSPTVSQANFTMPIVFYLMVRF
jgi:hypothetical protein